MKFAVLSDDDMTTAYWAVSAHAQTGQYLQSYSLLPLWHWLGIRLRISRKVRFLLSIQKFNTIIGKCCLLTLVLLNSLFFPRMKWKNKNWNLFSRHHFLSLCLHYLKNKEVFTIILQIWIDGSYLVILLLEHPGLTVVQLADHLENVRLLHL